MCFLVVWSPCAHVYNWIARWKKLIAYGQTIVALTRHGQREGDEDPLDHLDWPSEDEAIIDRL